jgi:hypothetical protein
MQKMEEYPTRVYTHSVKNGSKVNSVRLSPNVDEWVGIDQWISSAIEWKRREIVKQQMTSHINKMKTLRFKYHE